MAIVACKKSDKATLCFIATSLALSGGNERDVMKCIKAFGKEGRSIHIIAAFIRKGVKKELQGYSTIVWHDLYMPFVRPPALSQLMFFYQAKRIIQRLKNDGLTLSIISFEPNPLATYWVGAFPRSIWLNTRKKFLSRFTFKLTLTCWNIFTERQLLARTDTIFTYSDLSFQSFIKKGIHPNRLQKIIIPTDTDYFQPQKNTNNRNTILIIGTNPRLKGIDIMLEVWPIIKNNHPELKLNIVCKGWKTPRLVHKKNLKDVLISPFITDPRDYYLAACLVVMPSVFESWGNVPVEALSSGVPVVVPSVVPTSCLCHDPIFGAVLTRTGNNDAAKLADKILEQLTRMDFSDKTMQLRHRHILTFQKEHQTFIQWLKRSC